MPAPSACSVPHRIGGCRAQQAYSLMLCRLMSTAAALDEMHRVYASCLVEFQRLLSHSFSPNRGLTLHGGHFH